MSFEHLNLEDWIGIAGVALLFTAYAQQLTGHWRASDEIYKLYNLGGAGAVAYSLVFRYHPAAFVVVLLWAVASLVSLLWPHWVDPDRRRARTSPKEPGKVPSLLDAAIHSIEGLSEVAQRPLPAPGTAAVLESIALELRGIKSTLARDVIAPALGNASFATLEALFSAADGTLGQAQQVANSNTVVPSLDPAFSSQLGALRRVLEAQRRTLGPAAPSDSNQASLAAPALAAGSTGVGAAPPGKSDPGNSNAFKPDEAVLVAAVIEKLYGSAAFKIIGGALVAAALLAGAGTVYLGSHTLTLRADLEKTEEKGRKDIEKSTGDLQAAIDKQAAALTMMQTEIQAKKNDFYQTITDGKGQINTIITGFKEKSEELKGQIANDVVVKMADELKTPISQISTAIRKKGEDADHEIGQVVTQTLDPLKTRAATIDGDLNRLGTAVVGHDQELQKLIPPLNRLRELETRLDTIVTELNTVRAQQKDLADSVANAKSEATSAGAQAHAAEQSALLAEKARETVLATIRKLGDEASDQERSLGALAGRFASAGREIDTLEGRIRAVLPPNVDLPALARQTGELVKDVDAIKARVQKLEDSPKVATVAGSPELQRQVDEILRTLSGAKGKLGDLDDAVAKSRTQMDSAASMAQAARKSAEQADTARTAAFTVVETVRKDAGEQQRALGYTQKSIETLNQQIVAMQAKLTSNAPPPDLAPLSHRLDELAKRVDGIDEKLKPPTPISEGELTKPQIAAIQQRLADLGFDPKGADGAIGDNTRGAIRAMQRSAGQPATGTLTARLIAQLLSPLQPAKP